MRGRGCLVIIAASQPLNLQLQPPARWIALITCTSVALMVCGNAQESKVLAVIAGMQDCCIHCSAKRRLSWNVSPPSRGSRGDLGRRLHVPRTTGGPRASAVMYRLTSSVSLRRKREKRFAAARESWCRSSNIIEISPHYSL